MPIRCTNCYCLNPIYTVQIPFRPLNFFPTVTLFFSTVALCRSRFLLKIFDCYCVHSNDYPHAPFPFLFFPPHFFFLPLYCLFISPLIFTFFLFLPLKLFISFSLFFFLTFPLPSPPHKTSLSALTTFPLPSSTRGPSPPFGLRPFTSPSP